MGWDINLNLCIRVVSLPDNVNLWLKRSLEIMSQNSDNTARLDTALTSIATSVTRLAEDIATLAAQAGADPKLADLATRAEAAAAALSELDSRTPNPGDQPQG